jgi:Tfp pilus assembly protein PilO
MAISFREYPWYLQALVFFTLALLIIGAGEYVPMSPVASMRNGLQEHVTQDTDLNQQVSQLQVYERRYSEFKLEMAALEKQLDTLKTIVPEEKELDEFMRLMEGAASASGVQIRRLVAGTVVTKEYDYELPFDIEVDGPYFNIEDFFARLSRLSRIINVGDLSFNGIGGNTASSYPLRPGTTVTGKCTVITFFSKPGDAASAPAGKNQPARR